jgi:GNAT superfamily N-acetyltransferase
MQAEPYPPNNWQLEINPPLEKVEALRNHLRAFNVQAGQTNEAIGLAIFIRDEGERLIGGVSGYLWGLTLEIDYLWLAESLRGQGVGQRLMEQIEQAAVERGAKQATLTTFNFQAPDFYLGLGYEIMAILDGLGNDHQKYFLRKSL